MGNLNSLAEDNDVSMSSNRHGIRILTVDKRLAEIGINRGFVDDNHR